MNSTLASSKLLTLVAPIALAISFVAARPTEVIVREASEAPASSEEWTYGQAMVRVNRQHEDPAYDVADRLAAMQQKILAQRDCEILTTQPVIEPDSWVGEGRACGWSYTDAFIVTYRYHK